MNKVSEEWRKDCYSRHLSEVKKLNDMTFKEAENYCFEVKAKKGSIAARELWKSTEHYRKELERKEREKRVIHRNSR